MGMFEMSEDQVAEWRQKCRGLVEARVNGEEVVAAAGFRQGGATANSRGLEGAAGRARLRRDQDDAQGEADGLSDKVMLAVTPNRLYAFISASAAATSWATRWRFGSEERSGSAPTARVA